VRDKTNGGDFYLLYKLTVPGPIEDVEDVRVLEWHGTVSDLFEQGDLIVELETHKAVIEIRAGQKGILRAILRQAGEWQKIGEPLGVFGDSVDEPLPTTPDELSAWQAIFEII